MNIKELIEKYEYLNHSYFRRVDTSEVLKDLRQLDKPQKVKVPQFVADWYEEHKDNLEYNIWDWMKYNLEPKKRENVIFSQWLGKTVNNPVETLIKMKLFGYEVEKEKQYLVKFKGLNRRYIILKYDKYDKTWFLGGELEFNFHRTHHTRKELEKAGFGEVFNSTLFEVEEVE
nr:MAG TPA: Protein of unknown function (DUF1642) [Caudoviricetes sp.]